MKAKINDRNVVIVKGARLSQNYECFVILKLNKIRGTNEGSILRNAPYSGQVA
jgi:hypothetical protein